MVYSHLFVGKVLELISEECYRIKKSSMTMNDAKRK